MTPEHIVEWARKEGFDIILRDGRPVAKPIRQDAFMSLDVKDALTVNREAIITWLAGNRRPEWQECTSCKALVHCSLTPEDAEALCGQSWAKATKKAPAAVACPYRIFT